MLYLANCCNFLYNLYPKKIYTWKKRYKISKAITLSYTFYKDKKKSEYGAVEQRILNGIYNKEFDFEGYKKMFLDEGIAKNEEEASEMTLDAVFSYVDFRSLLTDSLSSVFLAITGKPYISGWNVGNFFNHINSVSLNSYLIYEKCFFKDSIIIPRLFRTNRSYKVLGVSNINRKITYKEGNIPYGFVKFDTNIDFFYDYELKFFEYDVIKGGNKKEGFNDFHSAFQSQIVNSKLMQKFINMK